LNTQTDRAEDSAEQIERLLALESPRMAITGPLLLVLALLSAVAPFATDL
jgi:hypothetical protein